MPGHRSLKAIQLYARILDGKTGADMQALRIKLESKTGLLTKLKNQ